MRKYWTVKELDYLRENYSKVSFEEMEEVLGRRRGAIANKARLLKLKRKVRKNIK